jgi:hypothetical protein
MAYRNGNYCAFYVDEPFSTWNLGANAAPDFCYYNILRAWKGVDPGFPFNDSHAKNYNVRDGSNWEATLKPRLRERLRNSKNIILFLSSHTRPSKALNEEIEYGIADQGLPVIVVYPDFDPVLPDGMFDSRSIDLWYDNLPKFFLNMDQVPTVHVPFEKKALRKALSCTDYMVSTKCSPGKYRI